MANGKQHHMNKDPYFGKAQPVADAVAAGLGWLGDLTSEQ